MPLRFLCFLLFKDPFLCMLHSTSLVSVSMLRRIAATLLLSLVSTLGVPITSRAADDYKPGPDSLVQAGVPKGELIKGTYTAAANSVFPGTVRDYTVYLPPGLDKSKPSPFMVFQDGVIYQAPTVFDNLIAKKEIPPLIGIFIKPGVVPAANDNALPRFNRSYEYDSVTDTFSRFLIGEILPAISKTHGLSLSTDPNDAAISGNSSGGICAFMVAWHRPDRFRRVFTGVGTYVGIHGADQLPVLIRKMEPKPLRVFLQSGTGDNNLYCGDWWMANQTMERSLTWAGYEVNRIWGEGGHNQKHATAIFPDVLRWLWKDWPEKKEVKANPKGDSKWLGYGVLKEGAGWEVGFSSVGHDAFCVAPNSTGEVAVSGDKGDITVLKTNGPSVKLASVGQPVYSLTPVASDTWLACAAEFMGPVTTAAYRAGSPPIQCDLGGPVHSIAINKNGQAFIGIGTGVNPPPPAPPKKIPTLGITFYEQHLPMKLCFSPDQTQIYGSYGGNSTVSIYQVLPDGRVDHEQEFCPLEKGEEGYGPLFRRDGSLCVDTEGVRLYVASSLGIQVCDQAGRVNFIILTPERPYDLCFGGKDLSELFIACGDKIYKRPTKVHGIVSGQMAPHQTETSAFVTAM